LAGKFDFSGQPLKYAVETNIFYLLKSTLQQM